MVKHLVTSLDWKTYVLKPQLSAHSQCPLLLSLHSSKPLGKAGAAPSLSQDPPPEDPPDPPEPPEPPGFPVGLVPLDGVVHPAGRVLPDGPVGFWLTVGAWVLEVVSSPMYK